MSGSFDVVLDDGFEKRRHHLNRSYTGLYVPSMICAHLDNFSSGSVCLVLASVAFDEADYYRDYQGICRWSEGRRHDYPLSRYQARVLGTKEELDDAYRRVMKRNWFILGEEDEAFEQEFADYCGVKHCVAVGNGFDARR